MRFRPPYLLAAAAVQAVLLGVLATGGAIPTIHPGEAVLHEGQGEVRVAGIVESVRASPDSTRVGLVAGPDRLDVFVRATVHFPEGAWIEATGRIARLSGTLTLVVADEDSILAALPAGVVQPSWSDLAQHPDAWLGEPLLLRGTVERGSLADGDGHHVMLGSGPWPKDGPVQATASLAYDASCICHRLHAIAVNPVA